MKLPSLNILEFGFIDPPEVFAFQVINSLFEEVSFYEDLGYKRLWLSEHYSPEFAWHNPEILIPLLAGYSNKIKLGIAGVLLSFHSPLRVAQNFKIMSSINAGRIDLGIARAYVPDHTGRFLISESEIPGVNANWEKKLDELFSFLREYDPEKSLIKNLIVPPQGGTLPDTWFLASSDFSLANAVKYKSNLCLSFMHPGSNYPKYKDVIKRFKSEYFKQHDALPETAVLLATALNPASERKAFYEAKYNATCPAKLFGEADDIVEQLLTMQQELENDEFVLFNPVVGRQDRKSAYETIIKTMHNHTYQETRNNLIIP